MFNSSNAETWLPWDSDHFCKSDLFFLGVAVVWCIAIPLMSIPNSLKQLPPRLVLAPIDLVIQDVKPIEKKAKIGVKNIPPNKNPLNKNTDVKPKAAKALPRAAAPKHPSPVPRQSSQIGTPHKPPIKTVAPLQATTDLSKTIRAAASPHPTALPAETPQPVSHRLGSSATALTETAQHRAQGLVAATGLGTAINSLTSGTNASPKAIEGHGLQKGGVEGGQYDLKLSVGGGGTGGNGSAKSGVRFGSEMDGDKTGRGMGSLSGRSTEDVSGGKIKSAGKGGKDNGTDRAASRQSETEKTELVKGERNDVNRVINQNKGRMQGAYMRALDNDPTMQGQFTVRLKIAPDGHVIGASVVSSDLNNHQLEDQLLVMIKGLTFSSGSFSVWEGNYKYNFIQ